MIKELLIKESRETYGICGVKICTRICAQVHKQDPQVGRNAGAGKLRMPATVGKAARAGVTCLAFSRLTSILKNIT